MALQRLEAGNECGGAQSLNAHVIKLVIEMLVI